MNGYLYACMPLSRCLQITEHLLHSFWVHVQACDTNPIWHDYCSFTLRVYIVTQTAYMRPRTADSAISWQKLHLLTHRHSEITYQSHRPLSSLSDHSLLGVLFHWQIQRISGWLRESSWSLQEVHSIWISVVKDSAKSCNWLAAHRATSRNWELPLAASSSVIAPWTASQLQHFEPILQHRHHVTWCGL